MPGIIEGSIRYISGKISFWIGLIDAKKNKQLWSGDYIWNEDQISGTIGEIVRNIANSCKVVITPELLKQIDRNPSSSNKGFLNYVSAKVNYDDTWYFITRGEIITV